MTTSKTTQALLFGATTVLACQVAEEGAPRGANEPASCPLVFDDSGAIRYDCTPFNEAVEAVAVYDRPDVPHDSCVEINERAMALLEEEATCALDRHCEYATAEEVFGQPSCIPAFSCFFPISAIGEHERLREKALALEEEYLHECGICGLPYCMEEDYVRSVCSTSEACRLEILYPAYPRITTP
jgi:hypothetical protein